MRKQISLENKIYQNLSLKITLSRDMNQIKEQLKN